jgi:AGZA family xanthine/uracil permease-like MFS transporter
MIVEAIPRELYAAVAVGIGLFIAFIGFRNAGIVVADPATLVGLGNLRAPGTVLALFGLCLTGALMIWRVKGAMLLGVVGTTLTGMLTGVVKWAPQPYSVTAISATFLKLDVSAALKLGLLEIIFVFLFVDLFDNIGTLVAVGKRAKLFDTDGKIPRLNAILTSDALATTAGSLLGTSTVVSYIESAAGVVAGGRSGVTAIVTGLLFVVALFVAPVAGVIPVQATAPALILVGALMLAPAGEIKWSDPLQAIPAFLTMTAIPLTFSIANGLAFGFVSSTILRVVAGKWRSVHWLVYVLAALCVARFIYLGKG